MKKLILVLLIITGCQNETKAKYLTYNFLCK